MHPPGTTAAVGSEGTIKARQSSAQKSFALACCIKIAPLLLV
jgi:hypothetical protein